MIIVFSAYVTHLIGSLFSLMNFYLWLYTEPDLINKGDLMKCNILYISKIIHLNGCVGEEKQTCGRKSSSPIHPYK